MSGILSKFVYTSPSGFNSLFEFMTGMRLNEYIVRRKLIKILEYKRLNSCSLENAVEAFEYSQESLYRKRFKETFGTTITRMSDEVYEFELIPKYTDVLLSSNIDEIPVETKLMMEQKLFDLPISKVRKLRKIFELSDFYGFDEDEADLAYNLSENLEESEDSIFGFVFDYTDYKTWLKKNYPDVERIDLAVVYINSNKSIRTAAYIVDDLMKNALQEIEDSRDIPDEFWKLYKDDSIQVEFSPAALWDNYFELRKRKYSYSDMVEILNEFAWVDDIEDAIEMFDPEIDMGQIAIQFENEKKEQLDFDILDTYTDDFLGISHDPDDYAVYNDEDE